MIPVTKKEFYRILEQIAIQKPQLAKEIEELALSVEAVGSEQVDEAFLQEYLAKHPFMTSCLRDYLELAQQPNGKVFPVHKPYSNEIRQRIRLAEHNEYYRNWANAVKAVPEYTLPIPDMDSVFIRKAKDIWYQNIYGNEVILQVILRHSVEYSKTGKTMPILLVGDPGVGKTLVAKNYSRILNLPGSFISGPSVSAGRGLSGAPNLYVGAGVGAIVQSMIDHGVGNPVICIDEIEKTSGGYSRSPSFQNELLAALDESNVAWYDNFLEIEVDASHIPFIFTANEKDLISSPLLDRMEVIKMENPTLDMIRCISKEFTLPKALKAYDSERIQFSEHELDMLVDILWSSGNHSCRAYQKAVELLVSSAYLDVIENDHSVQITENDIRNTVAICSHNRRSKSIGFSA